MSKFEFQFYDENDNNIITTLSNDIINLVKQNGWTIIKTLGQGSFNAVFEIKNTKTKKLAALLIPINDECDFASEDLLSEYKILQQNGIFDTDFMIQIYDTIDCNGVKITNNEYFCKNGPSTLQIVEKIDKTLKEKLNEDNINFFEKIYKNIKEKLNDINIIISEKLTIILDVKLWTEFVNEFLFTRGYYYIDWSLDNIGIINDRMVLIDLMSIQKINKKLLRRRNRDYKRFFSEFFSKQFENETMKEYKSIIEFYNIIIVCIARQKEHNLKQLIVFETKKILTFNYRELTKMYILPDFETLIIPSESKNIKLGKIKCIQILYELFKQGVEFYIHLDFNIYNGINYSTHMDDQGMIYLSTRANAEKLYEHEYNEDVEDDE